MIVISSVLKKIEEEEVQFALLIAPVWKTQAWFPKLLHQVAGPCYLSTKNRTPVEAAERSEAATSLDQDEDGCVQFVRQCLHGRELSADYINIICGSWRESTKRQYRGYQQKWLQYCCEKQCDPFNADINLVLDFLTGLYKKNLGYSALNTARSSFSSFLSLSGQSNTKLGDHFLVKRFMKGVFCQDQLYPSINLHGM